MYDIIIIGAGPAGMTAALYARRAEKSVLLIEKSHSPGGFATSFRRGRFEFEPSLHELAGVGNPEDPGAIDQMFRRFGADVDWIRHASTFRLVVPAKEGDKDTFISENGVEVTVDARMPAGFEPFAKKLEELVPGSYDSCMAAFDLATRMYSALDKLEKPLEIPSILKDVPDFMRITGHTINEVLDALGMPKPYENVNSHNVRGSRCSRYA